MKEILYSVLIAILLSLLVYYFPYDGYSMATSRLIIILFYIGIILLGFFFKYGMKNKRATIREIGTGLIFGALLSFVSLFLYAFYAYITYLG